jgi:enoyl-CoA hydratase/carnithine racemase
MTKQILSETKNRIVSITINRPEVKNALNQSCIAELVTVFEEISGDSSVGCIILSGQGKEAFCSGADLKEFSVKRNLEEKTDYFEALARLISVIRSCPKPVIAKVHGYALAGGLALVAASDIVLAANDSKFSLPELKVGMVPGIVMLALEEVINKRALNYLSLTADIIDADEALQIGLISKIYVKNVLDKKAQELAEEISAFSRTGLATTKNMLHGAANVALDKKLKLRAQEMAIYSLTPDCLEGIDAYLSKRKADFK